MSSQPPTVLGRLFLVGGLTACALAGCGAVREPGAVVSGGNDNSGAEAASADEPLPAALPYGVLWSDIATQTSGCFFFSGPGELGRNTPLDETAGFAIGDTRASLDFGANVVFEGPRAADRVTLSRTSSHDYSDGKWTVRETITLDLAPAGGWIGRYHYDEYEPGASDPGECHIDASVLVGM